MFDPAKIPFANGKFELTPDEYACVIKDDMERRRHVEVIGFNQGLCLNIEYAKYQWNNAPPYADGLTALKNAFRERAIKVHSDKGGDDDEFIKLKQSYNILLKEAKMWDEKRRREGVRTVWQDSSCSGLPATEKQLDNLQQQQAEEKARQLAKFEESERRDALRRQKLAEKEEQQRQEDRQTAEDLRRKQMEENQRQQREKEGKKELEQRKREEEDKRRREWDKQRDRKSPNRNRPHEHNQWQRNSFHKEEEDDSSRSPDKRQQHRQRQEHRQGEDYDSSRSPDKRRTYHQKHHSPYHRERDEQAPLRRSDDRRQPPQRRTSDEIYTRKNSDDRYLDNDRGRWQPQYDRHLEERERERKDEERFRAKKKAEIDKKREQQRTGHTKPNLALHRPTRAELRAAIDKNSKAHLERKPLGFDPRTNDDYLSLCRRLQCDQFLIRSCKNPDQDYNVILAFDGPLAACGVEFISDAKPSEEECLNDVIAKVVQYLDEGENHLRLADETMRNSDQRREDRPRHPESRARLPDHDRNRSSPRRGEWQPDQRNDRRDERYRHRESPRRNDGPTPPRNNDRYREHDSFDRRRSEDRHSHRNQTPPPRQARSNAPTSSSKKTVPTDPVLNWIVLPRNTNDEVRNASLFKKENGVYLFPPGIYRCTSGDSRLDGCPYVHIVKDQIVDPQKKDLVKVYPPPPLGKQGLKTRLFEAVLCQHKSSQQYFWSPIHNSKRCAEEDMFEACEYQIIAGEWLAEERRENRRKVPVDITFPTRRQILRATATEYD